MWVFPNEAINVPLALPRCTPQATVPSPRSDISELLRTSLLMVQAPEHRAHLREGSRLAPALKGACWASLDLSSPRRDTAAPPACGRQ